MAVHKYTSLSTWFDNPVQITSRQRLVHKNGDTRGLRACVTFANSFTNFLRPWTLSEVPMMIIRSGPFRESPAWISPILSPNGWGSSYRTIAGQSAPTLRVRAERATRAWAGRQPSAHRTTNIFRPLTTHSTVRAIGRKPLTEHLQIQC